MSSKRLRFLAAIAEAFELLDDDEIFEELGYDLTEGAQLAELHELLRIIIGGEGGLRSCH